MSEQEINAWALLCAILGHNLKIIPKDLLIEFEYYKDLIRDIEENDEAKSS